MEGFYCHPEPPLAAPAGFHACSNLEAAAAAAAAMAYECSTSSPPLSMAMEQLQGGFPLSFRVEASDCGGGEGDKGRMLVSIERRSTTTSLDSAAQELDGSVGKKIMSSSSSSRKNRNDASVAGVKGKRASRGNGVDAKVEKEAAGYIHVRAGRGQAMDSHSVAERLRREKISEKMKMLQSLVPGCEKLAGKALLDEIISYVQSLQGQVEFLSMKLATLNPMMMYELGLDIGGMRRPDAPEVLKTGEMPPHEEASQWMCQAASLAAEAQQNPIGTAQDDRCVSVMQLQLRKGQHEEEEELSNCMSMGFFPYAD